jgi:hypothetical protein
MIGSVFAVGDVLAAACPGLEFFRMELDVARSVLDQSVGLWGRGVVEGGWLSMFVE